MKLFDSHAHLTDKAFQPGYEAAIEAALSAGVQKILCPCDDVSKPETYTNLLKMYGFIYGASGIHPHEVELGKELEAVKSLLKVNKTQAIGEIGLDYHYLYESKDRGKTVELQKDYFTNQLKIAKDAKLPVIIHCREAWQDAINILEKESYFNGVFHCFSGSLDELDWCLKMGFYVSISGTVTYPSAKNMAKIVKAIPEDRLLIETDSPYLAPQKFRGKRNEPAYVKYVAEKIAEIKNISVEEIAEITFDNACRLFEIKENK
ncbi:MAG: hypothetical protein A2252_00960 [Elusimicrobia bacterium RIFOXYA2_FULL_39_19]|nr:MAG: hypothetical protein A2252_00960 [Elusimicrobia bacterium RIFOXYA2_FULL_39_19]